MNKIFILLLLATGLVGCKTYETVEESASRVPYSGFGEYGFTYDLDNSPSPFVDTSYRPLTPFDLAAPIIVVVTNQPPARFIQTEPASLAGETHYSGSISGGTTSGAVSPAIIESSGAQTTPLTVDSGAASTTAAPPPNNSYGGNAVVLPSNDVNLFQTNTNSVITNTASTNFNTVTNTNAFGFATNKNALGGITNTNAFAGGTNRLIHEPAGAQLQTNRPFGEPPGTQFRTNRFGEPAVPPDSGTNRELQIPEGQRYPGAVPNQTEQVAPQVPPASEPQNPPAPTSP